MEIKIIIIDDNIKDLIKILCSDEKFNEFFSKSNKKDNYGQIQSFYKKDCNGGHTVNIDFYNFPNEIDFTTAKTKIIKVIKQNKYDLIFLDYNLSAHPNSDDKGFERGRELLKEISLYIPEIPVVIITALAEIGDVFGKKGLKFAVEILDVRKGELTNKLCTIKNINDIEDYYINNISKRLCTKDDKSKTLPLKLNYNINENMVCLRGTLLPFNLNYKNSLKVNISLYYSNWAYAKDSFFEKIKKFLANIFNLKYPKKVTQKTLITYEKSYINLLIKKYKINLNKQYSPINKIVIRIKSNNEELTEIELNNLLGIEEKPTYFDFLKNYKYVNPDKITFQ